MTIHDEILYKTYKYYDSFNEKVTTIKLSKPIYNNNPTNMMVKFNMHSFKHCKFKGFYLIRFQPCFLNELNSIMIYCGKDFILLRNKLSILYDRLYFGYPTKYIYRKKAIIDEYCSIYNDFQKIKFIKKTRINFE